jgi:undecaprenyl-diphosphatase
MTIFQSVVLGLVQGLGEFLPISSSAHLILVPWFLKWQDPGLAFDVFLHMGTLLALLIYFFKDWCLLAKAGFESVIERKIGFDRNRLMFWMIVVGTIPGAIAGLLLAKQAETIFRNPLLIAIPLCSVGFLLYWVDGKYPAIRNIDELKIKDALWIGLAQAFAVIPGVSRSGATMTMARCRDVNREASARFSFMLCFPIILAAGLFEGRHLVNDSGELILSLHSLLAGFIASALSGLLAIHFLLRWVRSADFQIFAWYRILLAGIIVLWSVIFKV